MVGNHYIQGKNNMKNFREDLKFLFNKLQKKEHFAFSKYADGEFGILYGREIGNNDFKYNPEDKNFNNKLWESFKYNHPQYYVGIGCYCCMGMNKFELMKKECGRDEDHITWANIFVNANYPYYVENFIPEYSNHDVILICNENSNTKSLPFNTKMIFHCKNTAWENGGYYLINYIKNHISENNIKNHLFLFCAGPFGNVLAHQLHAHSQENIYLDIGSTLDLYLHGRPTRRYLKGAETASKICEWTEDGQNLN